MAARMAASAAARSEAEMKAGGACMATWASRQRIVTRCHTSGRISAPAARSTSSSRSTSRRIPSAAAEQQPRAVVLFPRSPPAPSSEEPLPLEPHPRVLSLAWVCTNMLAATLTGDQTGLAQQLHPQYSLVTSSARKELYSKLHGK